MQLPATVRWSAALLPLFGVLTAVGCNRAQPKLASTKPPEVLVDYPITREVTDFEECTGHTEAVDWVEVRAHVWGFLDKVNFREGALVQKGDVLFEIDPRIFCRIESVNALDFGSISIDLPFVGRNFQA